MKKFIFLIFFSVLLISCQKKENIIMESASGPGEIVLTEAEYLIDAKVISDTEYLIICKGYPKPGLTNSVQIEGTAKDAALIYAQITAKKRLKNIDGTKGTIREFEFNGEFGIVNYVIEADNIKSYIK